MKSALLILGTYFLIARATEDISKCTPVTYTVEAPSICPLILCLPEPTLTYTTKTSVTVTRTLPCATYTIGPVPVTAVKRTDSDAAICSPIFTTKRPSCPGCATTTKTTVVTSTGTYTTYKPCPTKTPITTIKPTLTLSTITATPKPTSSTTTKRPIITCPIRCSSPSGTVTVYNEEPAAVAPDVVCLQYCPLETM